MKITKSLLEQIIKEETQKLLVEQIIMNDGPGLAGLRKDAGTDWTEEAVGEEAVEAGKKTFANKKKLINPASTVPAGIPDWLYGAIEGWGRDTGGDLGATISKNLERISKGETGFHSGTRIKDRGQAQPIGSHQERLAEPFGDPSGVPYAGGDVKGTSVEDLRTEKGGATVMQGPPVIDPDSGERVSTGVVPRTTRERQGLGKPYSPIFDLPIDIATFGGAKGVLDMLSWPLRKGLPAELAKKIPALSKQTPAAALRTQRAAGKAEYPSSKLGRFGDETFASPLEVARAEEEMGKIATEAVQGGFESGVINVREFGKWYKGYKPNASREETLQVWDEVKRIYKPSDLPRAENFHKVNNQLDDLFRKYDVKVDADNSGGHFLPLDWGGRETGRALYDDMVDAAIQTGKRPGAVAVDVAIHPAIMASRKAGGKTSRALFHEIGHVALLKNPKIAGKFLDEYSGFLTKRIGKLDKEIPQKFKQVGEALFNKERNSKVYSDAVNTFKSLTPVEKKQALRALNLQMFKNSQRTINVQRASTGDVRNMLKGGPAQTDYDTWSETAKLIRRDLGVKPRRKTYQANFEETFAELFEKTTFGTLGSRTDPDFVFQSKNFPETAKSLTNLIQKEITPLIKEALFRLGDYRYLLL